ncbi:hypothetical protein [Microseira sp. BLCC-F43]|jgi:hypothetical protein|uniref:hypothetical protein n=1 Tax=Microseira sp. BLCC-F43 TaxID=3153602 RepID=UPI0035BA171A
MLKQGNEFDKKPNRLGLVHRLFLSLIPIATGYGIASTPAQAATLAYSGADFLLNNFSHKPTATSTKAESHVYTNAAPGSSIVDYGSAYAVFLQQNPLAYNTTLSLGLGAGNKYLGTSDSNAKVVGNFLVGQNESFKFDFFGKLDLKTSIDTWFTESAKAAGNIYFLVLDTTNSQNIGFLDYFLLSGNLSTPSFPDYLFAQKSRNVQINSFSKKQDFIGNEESASGSVTGAYRRNFSKPTNLTVLEVKQNSTKQQAKSLFSKYNTLSGLDSTLQANTTDSMLLSGATDLSKLDTSVETVASDPIFTDPIVAAITAATNTLNTAFTLDTATGLENSVQTVGTKTMLTDSNVAATATETSVLESAVPTLSQNTIVSAMGNKPLDTQGSYDSSKMSSGGDMKTAIANSTKAQTWLAGQTQYTALLPDTTVKDLQRFSNVSSGTWVDPPTTYGIEYKVEGDSVITNILDFFTDDADNLFTVAAEGKILGQFKSGDNIDLVSLLGKGVSSLTITDIDPSPGKTVAEFNFQPVFNTYTANLQARSFDKSASKSIPEPGSVLSLLALGVISVASRLFGKR